ncbi:MAG TPA: hypothetical protein VM573_05060 [Actinomycetota bacterium]|jgi:hypothetical protein|nr:hypothetical protein [Actinomycetota bacterium]
MSRRGSSSVLVVLFSMFLILSLTGVAGAHHKSGHAGGPKSGQTTGKAGQKGGGKPAPDPQSQHPSGNSREQNPGPADDQQGKSPSDPDGMENGGADKPGGSGGEYQWDQDGNNGCGNDTDFEDDNNGNCGGPEKPKEPKACPKDLPAQASSGKGKKLGHMKGDCDEDEVEASGVSSQIPTSGTGGSNAVAGGTGGGSTSDVLGTTVVADAAVEAVEVAEVAPAVAAQERRATVLGAPLPFTGGTGTVVWLAVAAALIAGGLLVLRARPRLLPLRRRH